MKLCNPVKESRLLKYPFGNIYQFFGENVALYKKAIGTDGHNGIDIVSKQGIPILATAGEIVEVKNTPEGYGKHIRILTPAMEAGTCYESVFGHLDTIGVVIGEVVFNGKEIATMGNTGFVISGNTPYWGNAPAGKGVHLHFGVRECSERDTGWITTYSSGKKIYVKNFKNGFDGYINPMKFLDLPEDIAKSVQTIAGLITSIQKKIEELLKGRQMK